MAKKDYTVLTTFDEMSAVDTLRPLLEELSEKYALKLLRNNDTHPSTFDLKRSGVHGVVSVQDNEVKIMVDLSFFLEGLVRKSLEKEITQKLTVALNPEV